MISRERRWSWSKARPFFCYLQTLYQNRQPRPSLMPYHLFSFLFLLLQLVFIFIFSSFFSSFSLNSSFHLSAAVPAVIVVHLPLLLQNRYCLHFFCFCFFVPSDFFLVSAVNFWVWFAQALSVCVCVSSCYLLLNNNTLFQQFKLQFFSTHAVFLQSFLLFCAH